MIAESIVVMLMGALTPTPSIGAMRAQAPDDPSEATSSHTRDPVLVATFADTNEVCLTSQEEEAALSILRQYARDDATLVLIAYSDATQKRGGLPQRSLTSECVDEQVEDDIEGHLRVSAFRGLQLYTIGHNAGLPGFDRKPMVVIPFDASRPTAGLDGDAVFIVASRSPKTSRKDRRVELVLLPRDDSEIVPIVRQPPPDPSIAVPSTHDIGPVHSASTRPKAFAAGALIAVGLVGTAVGAGFLASSAQRQDAADASLDEVARAHERTSARHGTVGGIALGIGVACTAAGLVALLIRARQSKPNQTRSNLAQRWSMTP